MDSKISSPLLNPTLLHLIHPISLNKLISFVGHIRRLRDFVAGLNPSAENSRLAKDVLLDVIDNSGVDLNHIELMLADLLRAAGSMSSESLYLSQAIGV